MARARATYDDTTKAAVMAALLAGQSIPQVAKEYNIPKGTLSDWRKLARTTARNDPTQKDGTTIDVMLRDYVNENLTTLREQAKFFRDTSWLSKQEASSLAVLHGVLADKSIRLLEVFGGDPNV